MEWLTLARVEYGRLRCVSGVLERGAESFESGKWVEGYRWKEDKGELHAARGLGGRYNGWETSRENFVSYLVVMVVIRVGLVISSCGVLSLLGEAVASGFDSWVSYWSRCAVS